MKKQIFITAREASQVVGLFPLLEDNQVHQEQIVTPVQPHVFVQEIPQRPICKVDSRTNCGDHRCGSTGVI